MNLIQIYYTYFNQPLSSKQFQAYIETLPIDLQQKIKRFVRWQDQHASLFARLLLRQALQAYQLELQQIQYTEYQRPFVNYPIDFNLAHSGEYVLCAITEVGHLGIDIEQVRPIEIQHFKSILTPNQWNAVNRNTDPQLFFKFWTQKESAIKADGRGLSVALNNLESINHQIQLQQTWFLHEITDFLPDYTCHLATDRANIKISYQFKSFYE
ncbi:4'-phosphopantetheinyl transferase superfamily protein [Candidatus Albibeggiatoa sp. nov. BB20]|uniref:4'-phosphopantetheinyl transferase family protein n=1 Tax=Candidatus Albibeggiatoa sp. nov. BB20 TaxID=3162723 RepID=UPI0033658439